MNRRGFLKFLSTATAAYALPAIGAAPALGLVMPGLYEGMRFDRPISAPPGSWFSRCSFSAEASWNLPPDCTFQSCFFAGTLRVILDSPSSSTMMSLYERGPDECAISGLFKPAPCAAWSISS